MRILTVTLVLLMAVSAWAADVTISCSQVGTTDEVLVSYAASADVNKPRAIALDISLDSGATITNVTKLTDNKYWVYPGSIDCNDQNEPSYSGDPVAAGGIGSSTMTIEMGSLHKPADVTSPNAPPTSGDVIKFNVSGDCNVTIVGNTDRRNVVLYDVTEADVSYSGCNIDIDQDPYADTCWDASHCPCQNLGDATCDGSINALDLLKIKQSWLQGVGSPTYNCCADSDHNKTVNTLDLFKLKQNWLGTCTGSDGTVTCPSTYP